MSGDIDEDAITLESLQAQIDMSMSFAQSLVSSWVKPLNKAGSSKHKDLESELLETMRRRPRLGVGAASSEMLSSSRETARLKGELVGKKRSREAESDELKRMDDLEDDEESRAGAIKKKVKVDPFGKTQKKKKASTEMATTTPVQSSSKGEGEIQRAEGTVKSNATRDVPHGNQSSPKKNKNKNKRAMSPDDTVSRPIPPDSSSVSSPNASKSSFAPLSKSEKVLGFDQLSTTSGSVTNNDPSLPFSPTNGITLSMSLLKDRTFASPAKVPAELLQKPLLNLQEISSDSDSDDGPSKILEPTPKKKRKRRKKKKKNPMSNLPSVEAIQSNQIKLLIS